MGKVDLKGLCLIEIGGDSCANCIAVMPVMSALAERFGLRFVKLDIEDDNTCAEGFKIDRIPTIILAEDGKAFAQCSGYQPEEIAELWIEAKLGEHTQVGNA